jgi:hypothetical protein
MLVFAAFISFLIGKLVNHEKNQIEKQLVQVGWRDDSLQKQFFKKEKEEFIFCTLGYVFGLCATVSLIGWWWTIGILIVFPAMVFLACATLIAFAVSGRCG